MGETGSIFGFGYDGRGANSYTIPATPAPIPISGDYGCSSYPDSTLASVAHPAATPFAAGPLLPYLGGQLDQ